MKDIDWIVFDAVGTVIRPEPSVPVAYHTIGQQFGSKRTVQDVGARFAAAFAETEQLDLADAQRLTTNPAIEEARWRHVVSSVFPEIADPEGCFQVLHDYFAQPSAWQLFDDTASTLRHLSDSGIRLAVASNFDDRLHSICDGTPPLRSFSQRFVSSELGFRKPSEDFYRSILTDLNVEPARVLMIGDSLENDILGALAVGMQAALISRTLSSGATDAASDSVSRNRYRVIRSLDEVEGMLS